MSSMQKVIKNQKGLNLFISNNDQLIILIVIKYYCFQEMQKKNKNLLNYKKRILKNLCEA